MRAEFASGLLFLGATLLGGCAGTGGSSGPSLPADLAHRPDGRFGMPWSPPPLDESTLKTRVAHLLPSTVKDRAGWSGDLVSAFASLGVPHATETYCAVVAVIEQESGFQVDPVVPRLPDIVHRELQRRADKYGVPMLLVTAALQKTSPDGRSYAQRIDALKTERQLDALFDDMIGELPFGRRLLADYNPVHTAGPMQVSIDFAEQQVREKPYPYKTTHSVREEAFSRRGGLYFGSAILLDYPAPYDDVTFRFADFNAGRYSSRNAAFQAALARYSGRPVKQDGDLLRYENGEPATAPSQVETILLSLSERLKMSAAEIRRDLTQEKSEVFSRSTLHSRLFALADKAAGRTLPRQSMPTIDLHSPKITRKLTTEWFARRVGERYARCLARAD